MKTEELEVGQSFDLVKVIKNRGNKYVQGKQCILLENGFCKRTKGQFDMNPYNGYFIFKQDLKRLGKLTITKLK